MNNTMTGIAVALAIIAAFVAGSMIEIEDGSIEIASPVEQEGPLEKVGEALDDAANE